MAIHLVHKSDAPRVSQGDIFQKITYYERYIEKDRQFELNILEIPFSIVLTQDCDLEQNRSERLRNAALSKQEQDKIKNDKYLISLLCAPLYNYEHLCAGTHLENLKIKMEFYNSAEKKKITQNNNIRYHYIEFSKDILLPPLVIDFKHYFTVSLGNLEEQLTNRIYSIDPLFRESISNRFAHYLSRIGLPDVFEKVKCEND